MRHSSPLGGGDAEGSGGVSRNCFNFRDCRTRLPKTNMQNNPNSFNLDQQLIADLRRMFKEGATVPQLSAEIHSRLSLPQKGYWIRDVAYFVEAFHLGINDAKNIGSWNKLTEYSPANDDEQINKLMMPLILSKQDSWDE